MSTQVIIEMTDDMFKELKPVLERIANIQRDRELSTAAAARKYGWPVTTLRHWKDTGRIPFTQKVKNGTCYFKESDLRKFAKGIQKNRKNAVGNSIERNSDQPKEYI